MEKEVPSNVLTSKFKNYKGTWIRTTDAELFTVNYPYLLTEFPTYFKVHTEDYVLTNVSRNVTVETTKVDEVVTDNLSVIDVMSYDSYVEEGVFEEYAWVNTTFKLPKKDWINYRFAPNDISLSFEIPTLASLSSRTVVHNATVQYITITSEAKAKKLVRWVWDESYSIRDNGTGEEFNKTYSYFPTEEGRFKIVNNELRFYAETDWFTSANFPIFWTFDSWVLNSTEEGGWNATFTQSSLDENVSVIPDIDNTNFEPYPNFYTFEKFNSTHIKNENTSVGDCELLISGVDDGVGFRNRSRVFEGTNDRLTVSGCDSFLFGNESLNFTIALRFKPNILGQSQAFVEQHLNYLLWIASDNTIDFFQIDSGNAFHRVWDTTETINLNEWNCYVFTYNGSIGTDKNDGVTYLNGVKKGYSGAFDPGWKNAGGTNGPMHIGERTNLQSNFNGSMDELIITNRTWTDEEAFLYCTNPHFTSSNLTAPLIGQHRDAGEGNGLFNVTVNVTLDGNATMNVYINHSTDASTWTLELLQSGISSNVNITPQFQYRYYHIITECVNTGGGICHIHDATYHEATLQTDWWNVNYESCRDITIVNNNGTDTMVGYSDAQGRGHTVRVPFNHSSNVSAGKALASGDDVRVIWGACGSEIGFRELDRNITKHSIWNTTTTTIDFQLQENISGGATDSNYSLWYNFAGATNPPVNESKIHDLFFSSTASRGNTFKTTDWTNVDADTLSITSDGRLSCKETGASWGRCMLNPEPSAQNFNLSFMWDEGSPGEYSAMSIHWEQYADSINYVHRTGSTWRLECDEGYTLGAEVGSLGPSDNLTWTLQKANHSDFYWWQTNASVHRLVLARGASDIASEGNCDPPYDSGAFTIWDGVSGADATVIDNFQVDLLVFPEPTLTLGPEELNLEGDAPTVSNFQFDALYGNETLIDSGDGFNISNLTEVEYMNISWNVSDATGITDDISFYFTANGTGCSLGNIDSKVCYNNASDLWIHHVNGTATATFNHTDVRVGDYIICNWIGSSTSRYYTCQIDEHYNPNVDKHYPYDFSDVLWQTAVSQRIKLGNNWLYEVNESNIPLNADFYKLDFRVNYTIGAQIPTEPVMAHLCNSSYETDLGPIHSSLNCVLVAEKLPSELQDDGTKFRAIFQKNLTLLLGDIKYVGVMSQSSGAKYYYMKTLRYIGDEGTRTNYSVNGGTTYTTLANSYESEININWIYNESNGNGTGIVIKVETVDTLGNSANSTQFVKEWIVAPGFNYPPSIEIITPLDGANVSGLTTVTYSQVEPNGDEHKTNITLRNSTDEYILSSEMANGNKTIVWNTSDFTDGTYNLTATVFEIDTTELYQDNSTHNITIDNKFPLIFTNLTNTSFNARTVHIEIGSTDERDIHSLWYSNDTGVSNSTTFTTNTTLLFYFEDLEDFLKNLTIFTNDTAGNMNSTTIYYTIDVLPTILFIAPSPVNSSSTQNESFTINISTNVAIDEAFVQWQNATGEGNWSMTPLNTTNWVWNTTDNLSNPLPLGVYWWSVFVNKSTTGTGAWSGNYTLVRASPDTRIYVRQRNTSYITEDIVYDLFCSFAETQCIPENQDVNANKSIIIIENNGTTNGTIVQCKINQTITGVTAWVGNSSSYSNAVNMTTSFSNVWSENIGATTNRSLWIWEDWAFPTSFDIIEYDCEVT